MLCLLSVNSSMLVFLPSLFTWHHFPQSLTWIENDVFWEVTRFDGLKKKKKNLFLFFIDDFGITHQVTLEHGGCNFMT